MKISHILTAAYLLAAAGSARADLSILDANYTAAAFLTHSNSDAIVSFDWDSSGNLYYATSTAAYTFGGLYQVHNGTTTTVSAGNSDFSGASVAAVGSNIYFNTSDYTRQKIYQYGPLGGTPTVSLASTAANYGLYRSASYTNSLFITGAVAWGTNHIYYAPLDASGNLLSVLDLGETAGSSGPITFDSAGNLYYAPGYGDLSIYRWTAAQLAAAIADPATIALSVTGQLWADYSSLYASASGATSMAVDADGNLLVTLTSFSDPSELVKFGVSEAGTYDGSASTILETTDRLGELRIEDGTVYVADGNAIWTVVPEPSSYALVGIGVLFAGSTALRRRRVLAIATPASR